MTDELRLLAHRLAGLVDEASIWRRLDDVERVLRAVDRMTAVVEEADAKGLLAKPSYRMEEVK
jgi:putative NIF3 family GTP cyclohydrolase 1 type 2